MPERPQPNSRRSGSAVRPSDGGRRPPGKGIANGAKRRQPKRRRRGDKAQQEHARKAAVIQAEVEALEKRARAEDDRWQKERTRLEAALRRARE